MKSNRQATTLQTERSAAINEESAVNKNDQVKNKSEVKDNFHKRQYIKPKISPSKDQNDEPPADTIKTQFHVVRIIKNNPFVWDGSYLGVMTDMNIKDRIRFMNLKYWQISLFGHTQICIIRQVTTSCPCISDELKILFGLSKLGTHRVRYHKKMYVLIKPRISRQREIIRETSISNIDFTDNSAFVSQVQDVYLFRDVLGLTKTNDNSIIIRWPDQSYIPPYPLSFYENKIRPHDTEIIVPGTAIKKWFGGGTLNDAARRIFRIEKIDEVPTRLIYIQEQLNAVIERVDREAVWMIAMIMGRITKRLLFGLKGDIKTTPEWDWDSHKIEITMKQEMDKKSD